MKRKDIEYPIDIRYGKKDWTMVSAIRELLSNMLDTKAKYECFWENGFGYVIDYGNGLPDSAFILGASTKDEEEDAIGQYGEGLKMALVTAIRNKKTIEINTVGYGAIATSQKKNRLDLLIVKFNEESTTVGTKIKIECSKEDWEEAINKFLALKSNLQKLEKGIFVNGGCIAIRGVVIENNPNLLFSYDFQNKMLTNRDRNAIKTNVLLEEMKKSLENISNKNTILFFLKGLKENSITYEEFSISFKPKHKAKWVECLNEVFGEKHVYATTIESSMKATSLGYTVIPSNTKGVKDLLKFLDVKTASVIARGVKTTDAIIEEENKISYPISKNYIEDWTILDAGREFLSNAIDSSKNKELPKIIHENGRCFVIDKGIGISREHFVIGNSQKNDDNIGMFGEGLKLACLVLARENRNPVITTIGTTYYPNFEESEVFGTEIFCLNYEKNENFVGTIVEYDATKKEVEDLKSLFLSFSQDKIIEKSCCVDIIDNKNGKIYINEVFVTKEKSIFSYNINDKTLINSRDRKSINYDSFSNLVSKAISNTQNEEVIEKYLTMWKNNSNLFEYRVPLTFVHKDNWVVVAKKIFSNSCVGDSFDMESSFMASKLGYEILTNMPPYIKEILTFALPSAREIAAPYKGKGILNNGKIIYPIASDYMDSMTIIDAGKELLSNALDTKLEPNIFIEKSKIYIVDNGNGISKQNLLFQGSDKASDDNAIGLFGEGLKMAMFILCKSNRNPIIETVGYTFIPTIEYDKFFETNLMSLEIKNNNQTIGTKISFDSSPSEMSKIKDNFLVYNSSFNRIDDLNLYKPGGSVFVNGVFVTTIASAQYSYDLVGSEAKRLLGRDRKTINYSELREKCVDILLSTKNKEVIKTILKSSIGQFELTIGSMIWKFNLKNKKAWLKIAQEVFPKSCLPCENTESNLVAKDKGYSVLHLLPQEITQILKKIGFPTALNILGIDTSTNGLELVLETNLSQKGQLRMDLVRKVLENYFPISTINKLCVGENLNNPAEGETLGLYSQSLEKCIISKSVVEIAPLNKFIGVVVHECIHEYKKVHDRTRDFEFELTEMIGNIFVDLLKHKEDIADII